MAKIKKDGNSFIFKCPGCKRSHVFNNRWKFNNDYNKPTLSPSLVMKGPIWNIEKDKFIDEVCHSFIKDGMIQFLSDCTHELANKTVELLEVKGT